ncbi:MAG: DNA primase [Baekduia sp.]
MPRYADDSREKVREATDIVDLVGSRTDLRRSGPTRFTGTCPFHEDRSPSFGIDVDKGVYHCFGCGAGGDIFTFVQETENVDFVGALEYLAQRYGVELQVADEDPKAAERRQRHERLLALLERATQFYERWLWDAGDGAVARDYLSGRGLREETLRAFRVGYAPEGWETLRGAAHRQGFTDEELIAAGLARRSPKRPDSAYDFFRNQVMFPVSDRRGRVLGFAARKLDGPGQETLAKWINTAENDVFHKGEIVYGEHLAKSSAAKAGEVILVEGYVDVLTLHQGGIENVVCTMGTSLTEKQVGQLAKLAPRLLLALDADEAGQKGMLRAEPIARGKGVQLRVVPLPEGMDPDELTLERGIEAMWEAVGRSVPFVRFRVDSILDRADLSTAEGKDEAIAELAPVFEAVPPSALREELLEVVSSRLDLQPALVSSWLPAPGAVPAPATAAGRQRFQRDEPEPSQVAAHALPPVVAAERDLLIACVASPDAGEAVLRTLSADRFSSAGAWRVAEYLRDNLRDPARGLPPDDGRLASAVAGIVADASDLDQPPAKQAIEAQLVSIAIASLDRDIEAARHSENGGIAGLRRRRDELVDQRDALITEALEQGG